MATSRALGRLLAGAMVVLVALVGLSTAATADPGPAYPPAVGDDEVVVADGSGPDRADEASDAGEATDADGSTAVTPAGVGAPGDGGGIGASQVLILAGAAALLAGGVVAIARRI